MINYIDGHLELGRDKIRLLARDTRRYAKRQYTWFSNLPDLQWFDVNDQQQLSHAADAWFATISLTVNNEQ